MDGGGDKLGGIGDLLSFGHDIADLDDRLGGDAQILLQRENHALRQGGFPDREGLGGLFFVTCVDTAWKSLHHIFITTKPR
jgi:hypothetical protein